MVNLLNDDCGRSFDIYNVSKSRKVSFIIAIIIAGPPPVGKKRPLVCLKLLEWAQQLLNYITIARFGCPV